MHEMPARTDPGLAAELEPETGDALGRNEPAIRDTAGKGRLLLAEQRRAHRRMDAVGADEDVRSDMRAVFETRLGAVAVIGKAEQSVAEMHAFHREGRGNDRQEVGAMNGHVRRAVELVAARIERRPLQGAAVPPAPLMGAERTHTLAVETWSEAEPAQDARCIRRHVDAAADLGQLGRLLVDIDFESGLTQPDSGGETVYAPADYSNTQGRPGHQPGCARPQRRREAIAAPSAIACSFLNEMSGS